ncbi:MAG: hypothetical protein H0X17_11025 [Deltaproteobacteria bacterium]|nr:hypothetical protein [Deltaproteobacteria bacterium]
MKVLASTVVALIAGCASNNNIDVSDEEYDDVAMSLASTLQPAGGGGELGAMVDVGAIARGGMPAGFAPDGEGSLQGSHLGLAYRYALECRDANNRPVRPCDVRTANADARVMWSGLLDLPNLVMVVERDGSWVVNDITDAALRLDGEGDMTYETRIENPDRGITTTYELAYHASHRNIVLGRNERHPRGGVVLYELEAQRTRSGANAEDTRDFAVTAELRFAAGGRATIELDGTRTYDLDLVTGSVVRTD